MTARPQSLARPAGRAYRQFRQAHPVTRLRWLRNGVLLCVLAAALLYLWTALAARQDIATVNRTQQTISVINATRADVSTAQRGLNYALGHDGSAPADESSSYTVNLLNASAKFAGTAQGALGPEEVIYFRHISKGLPAYLELSDTAVSEAVAAFRTRSGPVSGQLPVMIAEQQGTDMLSELESLRAEEQAALHAQRDAWALDPDAFWWVLLAPVIVLVLLVAATVRVLADHFRRYASPWLWAAVTVTAAATVITGLFATADESHRSADPWAGHPATITVALLLYAAAGVAAYIAYHPRLAEYRFQSS